ncbi:MAG: alpha/beta hydrolase [Marinovum sp.]|nr:alpha/beta hydrolase [Marinovum sp.]
MPNAVLAEHQTHWRVMGEGPRSALAVHCSLAHSGSWRDVSRHLAERLTITAFDLPGHGRSASWDGEREIQSLSCAIGAALVPDGGKIDVLGHSFGGTVALRYALDHPERVRSLTLIEPVFFAAAIRGHPHTQARLDEDFARFVDAWDAGDLDAAARAFTAIWGDGTPWHKLSRMAQRALAAQIHLIPAANAALFDDVGGMLDDCRLETLGVPVLFLQGGETHWIIPQISKALAARLPDATCVTVPGAGHMVPISHAKDVASRIGDFLDRT